MGKWEKHRISKEQQTFNNDFIKENFKYLYIRKSFASSVEMEADIY